MSAQLPQLWQSPQWRVAGSTAAERTDDIVRGYEVHEPGHALLIRLQSAIIKHPVRHSTKVLVEGEPRCKVLPVEAQHRQLALLLVRPEPRLFKAVFVAELRHFALGAHQLDVGTSDTTSTAGGFGSFRGTTASHHYGHCA